VKSLAAKELKLKELGSRKEKVVFPGMQEQQI
jgi:hypothetical protein